jgi:hypothetical protein
MAQIHETPKGSIIQDGKPNIMWVKTKPLVMFAWFCHKVDQMSIEVFIKLNFFCCNMVFGNQLLVKLVMLY